MSMVYAWRDNPEYLEECKFIAEDVRKRISKELKDVKVKFYLTAEESKGIRSSIKGSYDEDKNEISIYLDHIYIRDQSKDKNKLDFLWVITHEYTHALRRFNTKESRERFINDNPLNRNLLEIDISYQSAVFLNFLLLDLSRENIYSIDLSLMHDFLLKKFFDVLTDYVSLSKHINDEKLKDVISEELVKSLISILAVKGNSSMNVITKYIDKYRNDEHV